MESWKTGDEWDKICSTQFIDFLNQPAVQETFFESAKEVPFRQQTPDARVLPSTPTASMFRTLENVSFCEVSPKTTSTPMWLTDDINKKQEYFRFGQVLEEQKKLITLHPKPTTKFIIKAPAPVTTNQYNHKIINEQNELTRQTTASRIKVWLQKPFVPHLPKRFLDIPKTPQLMTTLRAQDRKCFNEKVNERRKQIEHVKHMESIAQKKNADVETLMFRRQLVHKAQPMPDYTPRLPQVQKRPLTEAISPLVRKRRRM